MSTTSTGEWIIHHPHEWTATFYIPLTDPIPFPDGYVQPLVRQLDTLLLALLREQQTISCSSVSTTTNRP